MSVCNQSCWAWISTLCLHISKNSSLSIRHLCSPSRYYGKRGGLVTQDTTSYHPPVLSSALVSSLVVFAIERDFSFSHLFKFLLRFLLFSLLFFFFYLLAAKSTTSGITASSSFYVLVFLIFFQSFLHLSWSAVAKNSSGSVSQRLPFKVRRGFASICLITFENQVSRYLCGFLKGLLSGNFAKYRRGMIHKPDIIQRYGFCLIIIIFFLIAIVCYSTWRFGFITQRE